MPCTTHFTCFLSPDELEAMLKDQNPPAASKSSQSSLSPPSTQSQSPSLPAYSGLTVPAISTPPPAFHSPNFGLPQSYQPSSVTFTGVTASPKSFISQVDTHPDVVDISTTADSEVQGAASFLSHDFGYDVFWPGWPRDLPSPALVRHL